MKKTAYIVLLFLLLWLQPCSAQKVSMKFKGVTLSEALRQIDQVQSDKRIVFLFDDLEIFTVTTTIHDLPVIDAVRKVCGSNPVSVTETGDYIFVEYILKTVHLDPVVVTGEQTFSTPPFDADSTDSSTSVSRRSAHHSKRNYYYSSSLQKAQPMTMPVVAPFTDIKTYQHRYNELVGSDSLTSIAHDLLSDKLDSTNLWNLKLIEVEGVEAYRAVVQQWAAACRAAKTPADVAVPDELLELMKKVDEPFLMFILQDGFERDMGIKVTAKDRLTNQNFVGFDYEALVADAATGRTTFYNRYQQNGDYDYMRYGVKPTSIQSTESTLRQLLKHYPDMKTYNAYQMDKRTTMLWHAGFGPGFTYYCPEAYYLGDGLGGSVTTASFRYGFLVRMPKSPIFAGVGVSNLIFDDTELLSIGPEVAYQYEIDEKQFLTFSLGLHYSLDNYYAIGDFLAGQASIMYHYRLNALNALGFTVNAQSMLYPFSSYCQLISNPHSFIENGMFAISYMMTIHK